MASLKKGGPIFLYCKYKKNITQQYIKPSLFLLWPWQYIYIHRKRRIGCSVPDPYPVLDLILLIWYHPSFTATPSDCTPSPCLVLILTILFVPWIILFDTTDYYTVLWHIPVIIITCAAEKYVILYFTFIVLMIRKVPDMSQIIVEPNPSCP